MFLFLALLALLAEVPVRIPGIEQVLHDLPQLVPVYAVPPIREIGAALRYLLPLSGVFVEERSERARLGEKTQRRNARDPPGMCVLECGIELEELWV